MSRFSLGAFAFLSTISALFLSTATAPGQKDKELDPPKNVIFQTADGVKIHGKFYRSPTKAAPAVIMVPNIGETSTKEKWVELAKSLQPSFSVLTFDFRGHGASVDIEPELYLHYPINQRFTKGANLKKTKLDYKDINKGAYTLFINDIAAAKSFLERTENELGACNVQNTIVIGVEQGATLAAIWANSEWHRYRYEFTPFGEFRYDKKPEGQYISALVCLSISPKLGDRDVKLGKTLDLPCKQNFMPVVFVHGDGDAKDKDLAASLEKGIKGAGKKVDVRYSLTTAVELKKAGKLRGIDLLTKSLNTPDSLNAYLKKVVQDNPQEWGAREFVKNRYAWKLSNDPSVLPINARVLKEANTPFQEDPLFPLNVQFNSPLPDAVDKNIVYDTYDRFVGR